MQSQSSSSVQPIDSVIMMCKREFDLDVELDQVLASADRVAEQCGSIAPKYFLFRGGNIEDFELELPCNVYAIEHVSRSRPSYQWYAPVIITGYPDALINYRVDQSGNMGAYNPDATNYDNLGDNDAPAVYEVNKSVFSLPLGPMIDYQNDNNCCLSFNYKEGKVDVLYRGKIVDARGYPKLPEKTLTALAYWMQYLHIRKRFNMQMAGGDQLNLAKSEYETRAAQARVPDSLSKNEADAMLNTMVDFNRKQHNLQFRR